MELFEWLAESVANLCRDRFSFAAWQMSSAICDNSQLRDAVEQVNLLLGILLRVNFATKVVPRSNKYWWSKAILLSNSYPIVQNNRMSDSVSE
jgi:hypothetical protein